MANEKETEILSLSSTATTQRIKVPLNEITFDIDRYCHRDPKALDPENLATLLDSITLEGLQVPVEIFRGPQGKFVLVKGHRRVHALRILADKNVPGFSREMEIEAIEVTKATALDLLIRSISDNEVRLNLDRMGCIRVAKKLYDAGVQVERAARAMGVSVKTYERDLKIAKHGWMFQHVIDDSHAPTPAYDLLAEAEKAGRLSELKEDLDGWIFGKKKIIREKEKRRKAEGGKELRSAETQVKNQMPIHLVRHWVELLKNQKRFDDDAQWTFDAGIEKETGQLHISSVSLNLAKAPVDQLAKVAARLSKLANQLAPYVKTAHEKAGGDSTTGVEESPYDLSYLRELGLEDMANNLEEQTRLTTEPDGEASPQEQPEEREEEDLTQEVQLPSQSEPEATPPATTPPSEPTPVPPPPPEPAATPKAAPTPAPATTTPAKKTGKEAPKK